MSYSFEDKREIIMSHYLNPAFKKEEFDSELKTYSNSCGDYLEVEYLIDNSIIKDIYFKGTGCAYFVASTDLLCHYLKGLNITQSLCFIDKYEKMLYKKNMDEKELIELGEMLVFDNVSQHANRLECVQMLSKLLKEKLINEK